MTEDGASTCSRQVLLFALWFEINIMLNGFAVNKIRMEVFLFISTLMSYLLNTFLWNPAFLRDKTFLAFLRDNNNLTYL